MDLKTEAASWKVRCIYAEQSARAGAHSISAHLETGFARALAVTHAANAARGVAKVAAATQVDRRVRGSIVPITKSRDEHGIKC